MNEEKILFTKKACFYSLNTGIKEKILITQKAFFYSLNTETTIHLRIKEQILAIVNRTVYTIYSSAKMCIVSCFCKIWYVIERSRLDYHMYLIYNKANRVIARHLKFYVFVKTQLILMINTELILLLLSGLGDCGHF